MEECDHGASVPSRSLCPACRARRKNVLNRLYVRKTRPPTRRRPGDVTIRASDTAQLAPLLRELDDALDMRDGFRIRTTVSQVNRLLRQPVFLGEEEIVEVRREPGTPGRPRETR